MNKDCFEDLITTIENNAIDNKATISNVKLWAKSWREERDLALELCSVIGQSEQLKEYDKQDFEKWRDKNYDYIRFGLYDDCGMRISNTELIDRYKKENKLL